MGTEKASEDILKTKVLTSDLLIKTQGALKDKQELYRDLATFEFNYSKKNKRELSFSRSTASNGAGQRRDWLAERSAQEDIKKNLFIRIAPILIGGGIIFCLDGCSELLPDGKGAVSFLMGIILLVVGISLRIHDKRK